MSRANRRERDQFLKDIEVIVDENPKLKKMLQDLWLVPPDEAIRDINQRVLIACRNDAVNTHHYL